MRKSRTFVFRNNALESRYKYLQKLYAILLLAVISLSVLPVKLLHNHGGEHQLVSIDFAKKEHVASGHEAFCPICSCVITQHYLPASAWETLVYSFPYYYAAPLQPAYLPAAPLFLSLRGPPAC